MMEERKVLDDWYIQFQVDPKVKKASIRFVDASLLLSSELQGQ